ncbi:MAG: hypothetical protein U0183_01235 [Polyangiaceae bacterium]
MGKKRRGDTVHTFPERHPFVVAYEAWREARDALAAARDAQDGAAWDYFAAADVAALEPRPAPGTMGLASWRAFAAFAAWQESIASLEGAKADEAAAAVRLAAAPTMGLGRRAPTPEDLGPGSNVVCLASWRRGTP